MNTRIRQMIKKHPRRTIVVGFLAVILVGGILLHLPVASENGSWLPFIDCLFMSTSAVCVTGLVVVDPGDTFTVFGEVVLATLIQIGGLGITSIGVITILLTSGKMSMGERKLAREGFNLSSGKGLGDILRSVLYVTVTVEVIGAVLGFLTFSKQYPPGEAVGISFFHSISAFNNSGFDIFGGFKNLADYHDDVWINLVTAILIILGGIGFIVISEVASKRTITNFRGYSLHTKIVLATTLCLIVGGTLLVKLSDEHVTWLSAFFHSVSARTAGFATESLAKISLGGVLVIVVLMFIGASPGSTGGGIKTTTFFVILANVKSVALNGHCQAFKRKIPDTVIGKALVVFSLALVCISTATILLSIIQPEFALQDTLFEVVSGFGTVGLSMGITPKLAFGSKIVMIVTMFVGRLGPLTLISLWWSRTKPQARYSEENITVG